MKYLQSLLKSEISNGIVLIIAAVSAMILANIDLTRDLYFAFLQIPLKLHVGILEINKNMLLLVNDALMAVFFLLVGLEVKRELVDGSLATRQQAIFPIIAAIGGMIVPALIYLVFNFLDPIASNGWAIPAATDIAFALGVLALLGNRVSTELKVFLMALTVIDDLGAIIIIALFYTNNISFLSLGVTAITIITLMILNICNVRYISIYMLTGAMLWLAILKSGVHPTLAGVIVSFFIPIKKDKDESPAQKLKHILHRWVTFLILPLFAFVNAGISLQNITLNELISSVPIGIIAGLFIGKPIGITSFCWLAIKVKLATLPKGTTWKEVMSVTILCGIGFTMSIFISTLAFSSTAPELVIWAKLGILIGSILSAFVGYSVLKIKLSARYSECHYK